MKFREAPIEATCTEIARRGGWLVRKAKWVGRVGAPDRMFARKGRAVWIEFKSPDAPDYRPTQAREMMEMREAGMEVYFCAGLTEFADILRGETLRANDDTLRALSRFRPRRKVVQ